MFHPPVRQQVAAVTAHQPGELPKSESTQPRCTTTMVTLYLSLSLQKGIIKSWLQICIPPPNRHPHFIRLYPLNWIFGVGDRLRFQLVGLFDLEEPLEDSRHKTNTIGQVESFLW